MPRKSKAKNFEIEDVNVSVVKNDDVAVSNNVKTEDTNNNNKTKEATKHETIDNEPAINNNEPAINNNEEPVSNDNEPVSNDNEPVINNNEPVSNDNEGSINKLIEPRGLGLNPKPNEPVMEVKQNPKPNKPTAKRAAKKTKIQPSQPIQHQSPPEPEPDHQPPPSPPQPIQRQNSVIHNPYLAQRKMAYTREGYEQRTTKYAELFKNAF